MIVATFHTPNEDVHVHTRRDPKVDTNSDNSKCRFSSRSEMEWHIFVFLTQMWNLIHLFKIDIELDFKSTLMYLLP